MSPHFSLAELTASVTATLNKVDNTPTAQAVANLSRLAAMLELVRTLCGDRPVQVLSGYRSPALNKMVGGSRTSAHMQGRAADIIVSGVTPLEVARRIEASELAYDQLIYERTWVHLGIADKPRLQQLTAHFGNGRVTYTTGITA